MEEKKYSREQVATLMSLAWMEGQRWHTWKDDELHLGSLQYLREKAGMGFGGLDSHNKKRAMQLMKIL